MQDLFYVNTNLTWVRPMLINQDQIKKTTSFLPNDHIRKIPSTKSGLHLAEKDAGKQVSACNRRRRFCRAIHQLMPEHFKTTHNLQGRFQKVEQEYVGLKTELAMPVCSTKTPENSDSNAKNFTTSPRGLKSQCALSYFHSNFSQILSS